MYNVVSVIPVSRDNSATDRFSGGIIFFNTDPLSSCEYLDIFHHLSPPALRGLTENGDNYSDAGGEIDAPMADEGKETSAFFIHE